MMLNKIASWTIILMILLVYLSGCLFIYLLPDWPVDDFIGPSMTDDNWYKYSIESGIYTFVFGFIIALIFLAVSFLVIKVSGVFRIKKASIILSAIYILVLVNTCIFSAINQ
jgi:hypothetical protein